MSKKSIWRERGIDQLPLNRETEPLQNNLLQVGRKKKQKTESAFIFLINACTCILRMSSEE